MAFRIETARLQIRPSQAVDRPAFERFVADAEMMRYISQGRAWDTARMDTWLARQARNLSTHHCCMGAVELKQTGEVAGVGGIQPLENAGVFELGWWIWKTHWNRGLATEMARGLADYAFNVMRLPRVAAIVDPLNQASIRVAEKLGMHCEGVRNARDLAARCPEIKVLYFTLDACPVA
jgi:RimJ/RimL family protein N-acetyltransferase